MVRADPPSACGSLKGDYKNAIVLAQRGQCFFSEKMAAGTAAGAAAMVIINDRWDCRSRVPMQHTCMHCSMPLLI